MRMQGRRLHVRGFLLSVPDIFCRSPCSSAKIKSVIEFGVLYWKMLDGGGIYRGRGIGGGSQNKSSSHYFLNQLNVSSKWSAYFTVIFSPAYPSNLSTSPPTTAIRRKATHTHTHLLDEVCTYVWCGAPIYLRIIPPFEYMILGSCRRSYLDIKWVQVIFVILLHSPPPLPTPVTKIITNDNAGFWRKRRR